jgi:hypothetical protein
MTNERAVRLFSDIPYGRWAQNTFSRFDTLAHDLERLQVELDIRIFPN